MIEPLRSAVVLLIDDVNRELNLLEGELREVANADHATVPWVAVIANDHLLQHPPRLWQRLLDEAKQHATLWGLLAQAMA